MAAGSEVDVHGNLEGTVEVLGASNPFNGTIEVGTSSAPAHVTHTGLLTIEPPLTAANNVVVHGNVNSGGRVQLKKGLATGSSATVSGDLGGTLEIGAPVVFGGDLAGVLTMNGNVSGTVAHYGLATESGVIELGPLTSTGKYNQTLTNPAGPWEGSLTVNGNMAGLLSFQTKLDEADVTVEGDMSGTITINEMYDSSLALNTVNYCSNSTSGTITIGAKATVWTPSSGTNFVLLNNITIWGDFLSSARLKFIVYQWTSMINSLRTVCYKRGNYGQEQVLVPGGVTPPSVLHCSSTTDPCCTGC